MNIPKLVMGALLALGFLVFVNVLAFPYVFPDGSPENYRAARLEPLSRFHTIALAFASILMAYMFPIGYRGNQPWVEGLRFGLLMGAFASIPTTLHVYAEADIPFSLLLTPILWTMITHGVAGALIGAVYGKSLKTSE